MAAQFVEAVRLHRIIETHRDGAGNIDSIRVQEPNGVVTTLGVADAISGMVRGTDAFFVCSSEGPWSPVTPWPYDDPKHLRSVPDHEDGSNLDSGPGWE